MDENTQAGRKGLLYANQKGIPVIIMEPLRGGKLVSRLPEKAVEIFSDYPIKQTPAQWAFKWLWSQPEVTCVLSGMNSLEMVRDNVATASNVKIGEVGEREEAMLKQVVQAINAKMKVGCTGCGYCIPCPQVFPRSRSILCVRRCARIIPVRQTALNAGNARCTVHSILKSEKN